MATNNAVVLPHAPIFHLDSNGKHSLIAFYERGHFDGTTFFRDPAQAALGFSQAFGSGNAATGTTVVNSTLIGTLITQIGTYETLTSLAAITTPNVDLGTLYVAQYKGTWSNATTYVINDIVLLSGAYYTCILGNTNQTPPNATYWTLLAANPDPGAPPATFIYDPDATTSTVGVVEVDHAPSGSHPVALTTDGTVLAAGMIGTSGTTAAAGNDSRLSDARTPTAHETTHIPGGSDALPWTTIHGADTHANRPAAASTNAGYIFYETDTKLLFRSDGATWTQIVPTGTTSQLGLLKPDGTTITVASGTISAAGGSQLGFYGDGSDGPVTFDGSTTILGMAPVSNVYTLTRDIYLAASTINNGVSIKGNGFRLFCNGILTQNGTLQFNGNNAVTFTGGAAISGAGSSIAGGDATNSTATAGGTGTITTAGTGTGVNPTDGGSGGNGGAAGTTVHAGGAAGTAVTFTAAQGTFRDAAHIATGMLNNAGGTIHMFGGAGGGSGGGDSTNKGGGGGSGGGVLVLCVYKFAGTGVIQARGGNGANGVAGNAGGGGGGGGGAIYIASNSVSGGAISGQTIDANGGTKGLKAGTGSDGVNGSNGTVVYVAN